MSTIFGEIDGVLYVASEYIEGEDVQKKVKQGRLPIREAVSIAFGVANALDHVHQNGIFHRDVKCANIIVRPNGQAVLVDFGLARRLDAFPITHDMLLVGTLPYMAPEVIRGDPFKEASELYSLGVVLYQMITGVLPYEGKSPESLQYQILRGAAKLPSELNPAVPESLDRMVMDLIHPIPDRRPSSASKVAQSLKALQGAVNLEDCERRAEVRGWQSLLAYKLERAWRLFRHSIISGPLGRPNILTFALLGATLTAAVGFTVGALVKEFFPQRPFGGPTPVVMPVAVLPFDNASKDTKSTRYLVEGVGEDLARRMGSVSGIHVVEWEAARLRASHLAPIDAMDSLMVEWGVTGQVEIVGETIALQMRVLSRGGTEPWTKNYSYPLRDILLLTEQAAIDVATHLQGFVLLDADRQRISRQPTFSFLAFEHYRKGRDQFHERQIDFAYESFQRALEIDPRYPLAHVGLATVLKIQFAQLGGSGPKGLDDAIEHYRTALHLDPDLNQARLGLLNTYFFRGMTEECLALATAIRPRGDWDIDSYVARGVGYAYGGLVPEAIVILEDVITIAPNHRAARWYLSLCTRMAQDGSAAVESSYEFVGIFGEDPEVLLSRGLGHLWMSKPDSAAASLERALEMGGPQANPATYQYLGFAYSEMGQSSRAESAWRSGVAALESIRHRTPGNPMPPTMLLEMYSYLGDQDSFDDLENLLLDSDTPTWFPRVYQALIIGNLRLGNLDRATNYLDAIIERETLIGPNVANQLTSHFPPPGVDPGVRVRHAELNEAMNRLYAMRLEMLQKYEELTAVQL